MIVNDQEQYNRQARMRRLLVLWCGVFMLSHSAIGVAACRSEIDNARAVTERIAREWPLHSAFDEPTRYVQKIANLLAQTVRKQMRAGYFEWPQANWKILLVRDLSVNAYSIGNGHIVLTDGAFDFVKNEAELVAILSHEMAHQLMGHFCRHDDYRGGYRIGSLVQVLDNNKEMEADALAVEILGKAGFSAYAMLDVVQRLPTGAAGMNYKQTRLRALKQRLRNVQRQRSASSSEFLQIKRNATR